MPLLLEEINKSYKIAGQKITILDNVSIHVNSGEIVSITGRSGCGKSTLLNIITGLTKPDNGKIILKGQELNYSSDRIMSSKRNLHIGQIFQTFNLINNATVMSNIQISSEIAGNRKSMKRDEILEILDKLGIADYHNTQTGLLSGGQKQRVAIARSLVNRPSIILADEPTANLDDKTSREIFKIMESLKDEGRAIIMVTHKKYMHNRSDRIYSLEKGLLKEK